MNECSNNFEKVVQGIYLLAHDGTRQKIQHDLAERRFGPVNRDDFVIGWQCALAEYAIVLATELIEQERLSRNEVKHIFKPFGLPQ